jgi:NAD(P)H-hydrate epimerase
MDDEAAAALLPERSVRGHKGTFGKLLVLAGSLNYAGAAVLVVRAAGRAGVGLVTLAVPESLQPLFAARMLEATTLPLPEDDVEEVDPEDALAAILDHTHDAVVIGPGLRPGLATTDLIRMFLSTPEDDEDEDDGADEPGAADGADEAGEAPEADTAEPADGSPSVLDARSSQDGASAAAPVVLDAEALRSLATVEGWWEDVRRRAVLTPHAGEFGRLRSASGRDPDADGDLNSDDKARASAAADAAREWRQVVVLKGAKTVIASPDGEIVLAPFENPALATGGTGDVLSGTIGSLLAQGLDPFAAARLGVYLHGLAGEAVRNRVGDSGLLAGDLPDEIAFARRRLASLAERNAKGRRVGFGSREAASPPNA